MIQPLLIGQLQRYKLCQVSKEDHHAQSRYLGTAPTTRWTPAGAGLLAYTGKETLTTENVIDLIIAHDKRAQNPVYVIALVEITDEEQADMSENRTKVIFASELAESQAHRFDPATELAA